MDIVRIENGKIELSSGLKIEAFAKTNMAMMIDEKGIFVKSEEKTQESFTFTETKTSPDGTALFSADFPEGTVLHEILEKKIEERNSDDIKKIRMVVEALSFAIENNLELPCVGGNGIIVKDDGVLFLPSELFDQCAFNFSESELHGKYIYKGLSGIDSMIFLRSSIAYKALTGCFPFEENDMTRRQTDIFDENFLPLEYCRSDVSENLAISVDSSLKMKMIQKTISGRRDISNQNDEKKRQQTIKNAMLFKDSEFAAILESRVQEENEEFQNLRKEFQKKQAGRIRSKRFLRRNKNRILAGIFVTAAVLWMANGYIKGERRLATTKGLDPQQTTALLYTMVHKADVPNLKETIKGKNLNDLVLKITGFYVSSKQRQQFDASEGTVSPAQWFFFGEDSKNWMYGITKLRINGKNFPAENDFFRKGDKPAPITQENGEKLRKGDTAVCSAEYYLVHQDSARIGVEKVSEKVTLLWNGDRWLASEISGQSSPLPVKSKVFAEEYFALKKSGLSVKAAVAKLAEKYEWIPDETDLKKGAELLKTEYSLKEAGDFLKNEP